MEPASTKLGKPAGRRVGKEMRKVLVLLNFTETSLVIMSITLSYYALTRCNLYDMLIKILIKASSYIYIMSTRLDVLLPIQHLNILIYILILAVALIFIVIERKTYQKAYMLAWILYLPTLLSFSKLDWLAILGFPINLESLTTSISPTEALTIGAILVGSRTFIYFSSQLKVLRSDLLARIAEVEEVDTVVGSAFVFALALTALSTLIVLAAWILFPPMEMVLKVYFSKAPHSYIILSLTAVFITTLCMLVYLTTRSRS